MNLTERLQEAFDKRVCGTAMLPASDLLSEILQARDEPVAYLDANYGFMRCGNAADHLPIGTKLYAVPPQPAPSVPEGYQLVPIEPTEAMQEAWDGESSLMGTWNAMLAAARSE